jgi:hypothetical protein
MSIQKLTAEVQLPRQLWRGVVGSSNGVEWASGQRQRLQSIDAVRGAALLFVGISHLRFYVGADAHELALLLRWLGYLASPNFLLISGIACGYQLSLSTSRATVMRIVDRGLFVLLAGHLLVCGSLAYEITTGSVFQHVVITDAIGLFLCTSPLIRRVSARRLMLAGGALFLLTSAVALYWQPSTLTGEAFGAALFSIDMGDMRANGWMTPTLAYLALFWLGVGIGKLIGESRTESRAQALATSLLLVGTLTVTAAVSANVIAHILKPALLLHFGAEHWVNALLNAAEVRHDAPPTPAYGLFYGGIGIAAVGLLSRMNHQASSVLTEPVRVAVVYGRASFVSYVCIQWLVDFLPRWTGLDAWLTPATSLLYLALVMVVVFLIAHAWDQRRANRYLSVGLAPR